MKKITGLYDVCHRTHPPISRPASGTREASEAIDKAIEAQLKRECDDDEAKKKAEEEEAAKREAEAKAKEERKSSVSWKSRSSVSANSRPCVCATKPVASTTTSWNHLIINPIKTFLDMEK